VLLLIVILVATSGGDDKSDKKADDTKSLDAGDIALESFEEPGPDPYTQSVATDPNASTTTTTTAGTSSTTTAPSTTTQLSVPPASSGGVRTYRGGQPGLYGGTRDYGACDPEKMIAFLDDNPSKRAAWAAVQGIAPEEVPSFIRSLTPVILRTDTWVLNHGYRNGRATPRPAILQAGTAVLVDRYGVPRVKCYCGNPLLPPVRYSGTPRYRGARWPGFDPRTVVIIQQNVTVINEFTLVDPYGRGFTRPAGSNGTDDGDVVGGDGGGTSSSTSSTTSTTTTTAPSQPPGPVGATLSGHYDVSIDNGNTTGEANWGADVAVNDISGVSGSGDGRVSVDGGCFDGGGGRVADWHAEVTFSFAVSGIIDGGYYNLELSRTSADLDISYTADDSVVAQCRSEAENSYQDFVDGLLQGDLKIQDAPGATAPLGSAELPGTVTRE
jgi:hypothetical protein